MAEEKKYISSVRLVDNSVYEIKDTEARIAIDTLFDDVIIFDCGTSTINVDKCTNE